MGYLNGIIQPQEIGRQRKYNIYDTSLGVVFCMGPRHGR